MKILIDFKKNGFQFMPRFEINKDMQEQLQIDNHSYIVMLHLMIHHFYNLIYLRLEKNVANQE